MKINNDTLLFEDLTDAEATHLRTITEALVLSGTLPDWSDPMVDAWMRVCEYDERQKLLTLATAFPQRALLSLLKRVEK